MSRIDVSAEIEIPDAAPADVAGVMFDPARMPEWSAAVTGVDVLDAGIRVGARVRYTGTVMGRTFTWTTEVLSFHFPHQLELQVPDGPFTGTVTYEIQRSPRGSVARVHTTGQSTVATFLPSSLIEGPMKTMIEADLGRLKALVENTPRG